MKQVIVTIDTEGHAGDDPVRRLIWGETNKGVQAGIPMIIDLCNKYGAKALFFVDFAETYDFGEDQIRKVVQYIIRNGHDVGVHIHPDHMADPNRLFLSEYSYDEQYDMIKKCTDLYVKMTGTFPKAFRAGKYGANHETLQILGELGYKADFSQFYGQKKWCHIEPPVTGDRSICLSNNLYEIPVTSYESFCPYLIHRYDKWDINTTRIEHDYVFNLMLKQDYIQNLVMFLHSFSLLNWRENVNAPTLNRRQLANLDHALRKVSESNQVCFISIDELCNQEYPYVDNPDYRIPCLKMSPSIIFFFFKGCSVLKTRWLSFRYGKEL